jgi:hypothetical protein
MSRLARRRVSFLYPLAARDDDAGPAAWDSSAVGKWDSTSSPLRVVSQEMSKFEFHISPARSSSWPQTGVGTLRHQLEQAPRAVGSSLRNRPA